MLYMWMIAIIVTVYINLILTYDTIFQINFHTSKMRWCLLSAIVLFSCVHLYIFQDFNSFIIFEIILGFCTILICDTKHTLSVMLLSFIVLTFLCVLIGTLLIFIGIFVDFWNTTPITRAEAVFAASFIQLVVLTSISLYKRIYKHTVKTEALPDSSLFIFSSIASLTIMLLVIIYQYAFVSELINFRWLKTIVVITCIIAFLFTYISIWLVYTKHQSKLFLEDKKYYLSLFKDQNNKMIDIMTKDTSLRRFRHDYNAHLNTLEGLLRNKNYSEAETFLKRLLDRKTEMANVSYTGIPSIDYLIEGYHEKAVSLGITWEFNGKMENVSDIDYIAMSSLFSNLLSNAIEGATAVTQNPFITTTVSSQKYMVQLAITNSCLGKPDISKSSKKRCDEHGYGLANVKELIRQKNGVFETAINNSSFTVIAKLSIHAPREF